MALDKMIFFDFFQLRLLLKALRLCVHASRRKAAGLCHIDGGSNLSLQNDLVISGILLHKVDSTTGEGIYGVTFLLYDDTNTPIGQYTSDDRGYVYGFMTSIGVCLLYQT